MIDFKSLASINGMSGLFIIVKPTRLGVILESLDANKSRLVINNNSRVSILKDISIYTSDADGNMPLEKVMKSIFDIFENNINVTPKSPDNELRAFLKKALPNYDESRVYASDIKKLVSWYIILMQNDPLIFTNKEAEPEAKIDSSGDENLQNIETEKKPSKSTETKSKESKETKEVKPKSTKSQK